MMNSHVQEYKRKIWRNLGNMKEIVSASNDKWTTAKFLWRLKTEMGVTFEKNRRSQALHRV